MRYLGGHDLTPYIITELRILNAPEKFSNVACYRDLTHPRLQIGGFSRTPFSQTTFWILTDSVTTFDLWLSQDVS